MRTVIEAQGISAEVETFPDGALRVALVNSSGHTLAAATLDPPDLPEQVQETAEIPWRASA